jgi:transcriptional regulator with PAS, ATPase and Fis domain
LNVFGIVVPPLRERTTDIPPLANYFCEKYSRLISKPIARISPDAMEMLLRYHWPGNVRELENAIERAMVVGEPPEIRPQDLPFQLNGKKSQPAGGSLSEMEKEYIATTLEQNSWNISRSAEILGIDRVTLYHKIEKYGFHKPA